jgi:hypothetical protein
LLDTLPGHAETKTLVEGPTDHVGFRSVRLQVIERGDDLVRY